MKDSSNSILLGVLWDIGYYEIGYPKTQDDSVGDWERRRKRRRGSEQGEDSDDPYVLVENM